MFFVVAATVAPKGLEPQDPTKALDHWVDFLGEPLSRKLGSKNFGPEPPPPPNKKKEKNSYDKLLDYCNYPYQRIYYL